MQHTQLHKITNTKQRKDKAMKVTKEICSFDELWEQSWSGAKFTLETIMENDKEDELMNLLEEIFYDGTDETTLNDYLWYDSDKIYEMLEIKDE